MPEILSVIKLLSHDPEGEDKRKAGLFIPYFTEIIHKKVPGKFGGATFEHRAEFQCLIPNK